MSWSAIIHGISRCNPPSRHGRISAARSARSRPRTGSRRRPAWRCWSAAATHLMLLLLLVLCCRSSSRISMGRAANCRRSCFARARGAGSHLRTGAFSRSRDARAPHRDGPRTDARNGFAAGRRAGRVRRLDAAAARLRHAACCATCSPMRSAMRRTAFRWCRASSRRSFRRSTISRPNGRARARSGSSTASRRIPTSRSARPRSPKPTGAFLPRRKPRAATAFARSRPRATPTTRASSRRRSTASTNPS